MFSGGKTRVKMVSRADSFQKQMNEFNKEKERSLMIIKENQRVRHKGCSLKDHLHYPICIYPIVYTLNEAIRGYTAWENIENNSQLLKMSTQRK